MKITLLAVAISLFAGIHVQGQIPTLSTPTASARDVSLVWTNNLICSESIANYEVQYQAQEQTTPSTPISPAPPPPTNQGTGAVMTITEPVVVANEGTATATIRNLTSCTNYTVSVRANCNDGSSSNFSNVESFETIPTVSSAPLSLTVIGVASAQINISWALPTVCTNFIMRYIVNQNGMTFSTNSNEPADSISGLNPDTTYTFTVAAENVRGIGAPSNNVTTRTLEAPPSAPLNFRGVPLTTTSVRVAWDPPSTPNGVLVGYTVLYGTTSMGPYTGMASVAVPTQQVDIGGLTAGTTYYYTVFARNSANGNSSAEISIESPVNNPTAPSMVEQFRAITVGPTFLHLCWNQPLRNESLTHYIVECMPGSGSNMVTALCFNVTGLQPETSYSCSVTPFNAQSTAGPNVTNTFTTISPTLEMPMNVMATALSTTEIQVTWSHPPFNETIEHIFVNWVPTVPPGVSYTPGSIEIMCASDNMPMMNMPNCGDVTEYNITGLEEYIAYTVTVIASNSAGNSSSGSATATTMSAAPDGVATSVTAAPTYNSVSLSWSAVPVFSQNGPNLRYIVTITRVGSTDAPFVQTVSTLTTARMGLMPLTMYRVTITATNDVANAAVASTPVDFTTLEMPPNAGVTNITVSSDNSGTQATITWTPPAMGTITMYSIVIRDASGAIVTSASAASPMYTASGLSPYIPYTVTITAETSGGPGPATSHTFYTLQDVPTTTVSNIQGTANTNELTVSFDPITNSAEGRGNLTYTVCYTLRGGTDQVCQVTDTSPATFPGNFAGNVYAVTVTPMTAAGQGMASTGVLVDGRTGVAQHNIVLIVTLCVVIPIVAFVVVVGLIMAIFLLRSK